MKVIPCIGSNLSFENKELSFRKCAQIRFEFWTFNYSLSGSTFLNAFSVRTTPPGSILIDWGDDKPDDIINSGGQASHIYGGSILPFVPNTLTPISNPLTGIITIK
jgi:hypothetical protein